MERWYSAVMMGWHALQAAFSRAWSCRDANRRVKKRVSLDMDGLATVKWRDCSEWEGERL
jgi:hypothetical protein